METVPDGPLYNIMNNLLIKDIIHLCEISNKFHDLCKSSYFWEKIYERDFPKSYKILQKENIDWKKKVIQEDHYKNLLENTPIFIYQDDPALKGIFKAGWEKAWDIWHNIPAIMKTDKFWDIFHIIKTSDPNAMFYDINTKKAAEGPRIYSRRVSYLLSPSITNNIVGGLQTYFMNFYNYDASYIKVGNQYIIGINL